MSLRSGTALLGIIACVGLNACGDDDPKQDSAELSIVDPSNAYGKTYAEWSAEWIEYVNSVSPPECANPLMDASGASCALYQDEDSPVFFLTGNYGGVSIRDECVAPAGKALFFPLLNIWGDNAGVPADMLLSDADIRAYVESSYENVIADSLHVSLDGVAIEGLDAGGVPSAPYQLELAPEANTYYCAGVEDVAGEFPGHVSGYWAMLPPLAAGAHTLEFGASSQGTATTEGTTIDMRYELLVH